MKMIRNIKMGNFSKPSATNLAEKRIDCRVIVLDLYDPGPKLSTWHGE